MDCSEEYACVCQWLYPSFHMTPIHLSYSFILFSWCPTVFIWFSLCCARMFWILFLFSSPSIHFFRTAIASAIPLTCPFRLLSVSLHFLAKCLKHSNCGIFMHILQLSFTASRILTTRSRTLNWLLVILGTLAKVENHWFHILTAGCFR